MEKSCRTSPSVHHCTVAPPTPSAGASSMVKPKGAVNSLKSAAMQQPDSCETGEKFLPQRSDDTNASVRLHVIRYTSSNARKVLQLTVSQLRLPQSQLYLEGGDVCVHVCYENVFALQLQVEGVQVRCDVRQQG